MRDTVAIGIDDPATVIDPAEAAAVHLEAERDVVLTAPALEPPAEIDGVALRVLDAGRDEAWATWSPWRSGPTTARTPRVTRSS